MICWRCKEAVAGAVCAGCTAVQPPPADADLFAVLGLERAWHVDRDVLEAAWRDRSRRVHPDRFARASAVERRMSLQWTALLNDARRTLRDPTSRAWYLATGQARPPEVGGPPMPADFLEQVFDWRMAADDEPTRVREEAWAERALAEAHLESTFTTWEQGRGDLGAVAGVLARIRYLDSLLRELPVA